MTSFTITPDDKKAGFTLRELDAVVHHLVASGFHGDTSRITAATNMRGRITSLTAKTVNDPAPPHASGPIKAASAPTLWVLAGSYQIALEACEKRGIKVGSAGNDAHGVKVRTTDRSLRGAVVKPGDRLLALDAPADVIKSFELAMTGSCGYADLDVLS